MDSACQERGPEQDPSQLSASEVEGPIIAPTPEKEAETNSAAPEPPRQESAPPANAKASHSTPAPGECTATIHCSSTLVERTA